jgi:5-(carboxyamino)imidazole ribonucleotide synthase
MNPILPGACIGVVGGGQLGRMLMLAGRNLGYRFVVLDPDPNCPGAAVADRQICATFTDESALLDLVQSCDVVTYEFEGLPVESMRWIETTKPLRPSANVLSICQNRYREKQFLKDNGLPHVPFAVVHNAAELQSAILEIGLPCVLKTAYFGYDGKGQVKIDRQDVDYASLFDSLGVPTAILEAWVPHEAECSLMVSRRPDGVSACFPVAENEHRRHILHRTVVPARLSNKVQELAEALAMRIAGLLQLEGTLGVEFFVMEGERLLVNEMAPRPHNSGHYSMDASITSQFEQSIRAICGLPLGSTDLRQAVVMLNLMGDHWHGSQPPDWAGMLALDPCLKLHLYGKKDSRPGRKMGHVNCLGKTVDEALALEERVEQALKAGKPDVLIPSGGV